MKSRYVLENADEIIKKAVITELKKQIYNLDLSIPEQALLTLYNEHKSIVHQHYFPYIEKPDQTSYILNNKFLTFLREINSDIEIPKGISLNDLSKFIIFPEMEWRIIQDKIYVLKNIQKAHPDLEGKIEIHYEALGKYLSGTIHGQKPDNFAATIYKYAKSEGFEVNFKTQNNESISTEISIIGEMIGSSDDI